MKPNFITFFILLILAISCNFDKNKYKDPTLPIEERIESLLSQMTLEEKLTLLSGDSTGFNIAGIERLGIPPLPMADGPVGVRVDAATAFPVSVNMASSWDTSLIERFGIALGAETRAKGKAVILGPCVGIQRFPLGGRNFESLGEDPYLSSRLAVNYIKGVQSQDVIATIKHYACNDQEWERNYYDVIVDERTLREVHLAPFEAAVKEAGVQAVMTSYNIINGQHASENKHLIKEILKDDWKFQGIVISDWVSVYSAVDAANNGLDAEMPKPIWFGDSLKTAIEKGLVSQEQIDDKVRRHLRVRFLNGFFDKPLPSPDQTVVESEKHKMLALEMAQKSIILVKNKDKLLPLSKEKIKSIALIGPNANEARTGGGGSSIVFPWHKVSPNEGLQNLIGDKVAVNFSEGVDIKPFKAVPVPAEFLFDTEGKPGLKGEYFSNRNWEGKPAFVRNDSVINFGFKGGSPGNGIPNDNFSIRWTGKLIPPVSKKYNLAITSDDGSFLYINDKLMIDNGGQHGEVQLSSEVYLEAGKAYNIRIEFTESGGDAAMRLLWKDPVQKLAEPTIADAVAQAGKSDIAILCVGNSFYNEAEGADVQNFDMIADQELLIKSVAKVNPNTIVVVYGGVPVYMKSWINDVKAVLIAGYPGQEGGTALAQIIFGEVNPSGKLPYSYIQMKEESPGFNNYKKPDLKVPYSEGIFVGYKYYEKNDITPLFPFGFGLSYTEFEYSDIQIKQIAKNQFSVKVSVKNIGSVEGEEIVQLYLGNDNPSIPRPIKELRGFNKVKLLPGMQNTIEFILNEKHFQIWDMENNCWKTEPGNYTIHVGSSSADIKLKGNVVL